MEDLWQHALVAVVAVAAVAWLVWRRVKRRRGCSECALTDAVTRASDAGAERPKA